MSNELYKQDEALYYTSDTYASLKHRTVFITDDIDEDTYTKFVSAFKYLEQTDEPINILLCTPGGVVTYMFSMYDMMRSSKNEVISIGTGWVCSAGVLLLAGANKRYVTENCVLMSHAGESEMEGRVTDIEERLKVFKWEEARWCDLMARHTPQDAAQWKQWTKRKSELWYLGGEAIVEAGLADSVLMER